MALGETAVLVAELQLVDKFSGTAKKALSGLNKIDRAAANTGKGFYTLGAGIGTAIRRGTVLAIAGLGALGTLLALSVKEGQEAQNVQLVYAKAIDNSAKSVKGLSKELATARKIQAAAKPGTKEFTAAAKAVDALTAKMKYAGAVTAAQTAKLNAQQLALMDLAGMDDELIKAEQTKLIQMGLNGDVVAKLTPLVLDLSKATGRDLLQSAVAVGKAVNGNAAGLQRFGVFVDKAKFKIDPLAATMDALNQKFGGTTKALSGQLDTRLGALHARLGNIREDIGIKLLPALTRIVDVVGRSLVPAFQKFIDRILPDISKAIDEFAGALENGGAENAIKGIGDALGTVYDLLKLIAAPAKAIVGVFMSLPKELQGLIIGGAVINKLSGGMIGKGIMEIVFQRGGSPANPMFVADVTGGLGGGGIAGKGGKGLLGTLLSLPVLIGGAVIAAATTATWQNAIMPGLQDQSGANNDAVAKLIKSGTIADMERSLKGLQGIPEALNKDPLDFVGALDRALYEFDAAGVKSHNEALIAALKAAITQAKAEEAAKPTPGVDLQGAGISAQRPRGEHAGRISNATRAGIILRVTEKTGKAPTSDRVTAILTKTRDANAKKLDALNKTVRSGDDVMAQKLAALDSATRGVTSAVNGTTAAVNRWAGFTIPAPSVTVTVNAQTGFTTRTLARKTTVARAINPAPIPGRSVQPT